MSNAQIFDIHDENEFIDRVLGAKYPVIVGFFEPENDACETVSSRTKLVLDHRHEKTYMAKVNIAEHSDLSQKCDVKAGPVLAIAKDGNIQKKLPGLPELEEIQKFVEDAFCES